MKGSSAVVFDVGNVLYRWEPRALYTALGFDTAEVDRFLAEVWTPEWHFQHDAGIPFAETAPPLIACFPEHRALIEAWGAHFLETIPGTVAGMAALVDELDAAGVPLFAITNFSGEFWWPFRAREAAMFDRFRGIVVSGDEGVVKPDPAIYQLALARFGLAADEAVFVDDVPANVAGAEAVGMHAVLFTDAAALRERLAGRGLLA